MESAPPRPRKRDARPLGSGGRVEPRDGSRDRADELCALERSAVRDPDGALADRDVRGSGPGRERLDRPRSLREPQDSLGVRVHQPDDTVADGNRARGPTQGDPPLDGAGRGVERHDRTLAGDDHRRAAGLVVVHEQQDGGSCGRQGEKDGGRTGEQQSAAAAARRPAARGRVDDLVVREDRLLDPLQLGARLEPELADQHAAGVGVHIERLRLAARPVEREHQLDTETLAVGVLAHQPAQLADELGVAADREVGVDPRLYCLEPFLLEPRQRIAGKRLADKVGERLAPPELECGAQDTRRLLGAAFVEEPPAFRAEALEPREVELLRVDREHVSRRPRLEDLMRLEQLPEPGNVLLERGRSVLGRMAAPELLDQPIARDDATGVEQEQGEQTPLLEPAQPNLSPALEHLERPEDREVKDGGQSATVPRVSAP